jgi:hypothetical protein
VTSITRQGSAHLFFIGRRKTAIRRWNRDRTAVFSVLGRASTSSLDVSTIAQDGRNEAGSTTNQRIILRVLVHFRPAASGNI